MDSPTKKLLRCAIYTRKSTDHNLDLEFNSLDAQREACEAYIKSQAHEGWRLITNQYDDGAFSGASLERPALQRLLKDVRARKVDIIVVYKVDRLTRSLADFAKLVELFDQYAVSFVSVTQSFNTTSSMGRLTLNVLLSFAQFEREVIGERVRDKIAASKAKGIWVGGSVPLGYASVNKKLVVVPEEAKTVRSIFRRYLEIGSIRDLVEDMDRKGIRTRRQTLATGKVRGGIRFGVGTLAGLLRNRFYVGDVAYKGKVHRGEQEPIVDRALFDAVQAKLTDGANVRQARLRGSPSILTGRIFDEHGNRMTPTHTNKQGARYRYYVSHTALQKRTNRAEGVLRVSAPEIECKIVETVRMHLKAQKRPQGSIPTDDRALIEQCVDKIVVKTETIEIRLAGRPDGPTTAKRAAAQATLTFAWGSSKPAALKGIIHSPLEKTPLNPDQQNALLLAIAKARSWIEDLTEGRVTSLTEIAQREGKVERHIRLLAPLAFVSPGVILKIIDGKLPITVTDLAKSTPHCWPEPCALRSAE
jgi:DNA invertase Pin-like site-specific DNA recombinase